MGYLMTKFNIFSKESLVFKQSFIFIFCKTVMDNLFLKSVEETGGGGEKLKADSFHFTLISSHLITV